MIYATVEFMKIAQVAPLYESVPPQFYGGTERIVFYLTEELVKQKHEVSLFASADSTTSARLIPCCKKALRLDENCFDSLAPHVVQIQQVLEMADEFDIIHFHTDYLHFPSTENLHVPHITTLHGKLDIPELQMIYNTFQQPVISISNSQRKPLPQANFIGTVYHGLPPDLLKNENNKRNYLAFLGRVSPEKGLDKAIEWAIAANRPLKIAAKIDKADKDYYENEIKPLLDHPLIGFIGEINEAQKQDFLSHASALLFPINWNEPFGIVLIEAMACGTPVIAHGMGSVNEIIENGKNGFVVSTTEEALKAIHAIDEMDFKKIRNIFEERFTSNRMSNDYLKLYKKLIASHSKTNCADIIALHQHTEGSISKFEQL
jgi:glycosyltransferase involved in cell wall biosynthesis